MSRGPDRAERALPTGPAARRRRRRLHRAEARAGRDQVRPAADGAACSRTPTASSPIRSRSCGWPASWPASRSDRPTNCGARWARRTPRRCGQARRVRRGLQGEQHLREEGDEDLRVHRVLRRLRLSEGALDHLRLLAYQTAYLKANYPRHFMAALLTIESQSSDKVALYLAECRELGVPVLPPDINTSQLQFVVQPDGVRFGLGAVKGAGEGAIASDPRDPAGARRPHLIGLRAGRAHRPAPREQEGARVADQSRRVRYAVARRPRRLPRVAAAADRRARSDSRSRRPSPARSRSGAGTAVRW